MANLVTPPALDWTDPQYSLQVGNLQQAYTNAITPLQQQRQAQAARFGYTPTYDANGFVQSVSVDPTDPYSKANLMAESYHEAQKRNTNSFAGRGQLYAGSLQGAQDQSTKGYNIGSNNLQQAFIDFIAGNQGQINAAGDAYNQGIAGAYGDAYGRYVPPDTSSTAPTAPTGPAPAQGFTSTPSAPYNVFPTNDGKGEWHVYPPGPDGTQRKVYVKY